MSSDRPVISDTCDQELGKPGTEFWPGYPIVVRRVEQFTGWTFAFLIPYKENVLSVALRGTYPSGVVHQVMAFCPTDIFRVAKETHVL